MGPGPGSFLRWTVGILSMDRGVLLDNLLEVTAVETVLVEVVVLGLDFWSLGVFIQSLDSVDDLVDEDVGGVLQVGEVLRKLRDLKVLDLDCNLSYFCNANGKKKESQE